MRYGLLTLLLAATVGCASLRQADGTINVIAILTDASWGLSAACSQEWVPADACVLGQDAFRVALSVAQKNLPGTAAAVVQVLVDWEAKVPATSRLRPYLDGAILLLRGSASMNPDRQAVYTALDALPDLIFAAYVTALQGFNQVVALTILDDPTAAAALEAAIAPFATQLGVGRG